MKKILYHKYEVLRPIAEGGMGSVYLVKDLHLNKLAAVKVSKKKLQGIDGTMMKEREVLKQLSHQALPQIIDFFEEGGECYLVMEYVEGITLEQYLRKFGRVEVDRAVKWAVELSEVLNYLHHQNPPIIYRDLKPSNIMVQPSGKLKLIDFGAVFHFSADFRKEAFLLGTPGYSAPEQWQGGKVGKESDIYALGAVLHEMLTGLRPRQELILRRPVREYDKSIPGKLEKIVANCIKKRPSERYQSMEQLKEELLSYKKNGIGRKVQYGMQKGIGLILWLLAVVRTFGPLWQGVQAEEFPFPFLKEPILLFGIAAVYHTFFIRRSIQKQILKRQEKSIFLTEKKFSGWYVAGLIFLLFFTIPTIAKAEGTDEFWVDLRDEQNRKLLLKDGSVYYPKERVRFEIPCEKLPDGQLSLQILATDERGGIHQSRVFLVQKQD